MHRHLSITAALLATAAVAFAQPAPVISLDLVQGEWEAVELPPLPGDAGLEVALGVDVPDPLPSDAFELFWEHPEDHWLLPAATHARPSPEARAWLVIRRLQAAPGEYRAPVTLARGGREVLLCTLALELHDLTLPPPGNFLYKPWYDVTVWGSRDADPEQQHRVEAVVDHMTSLRVTVGAQGMPFNDYVTRALLADSGEPLSVLKERPEVLAADPLPEIDFSRYDPWYQPLLEAGVTRIDIHQGWLTDRRLDNAIEWVTGRQYHFGDPEWERYYLWLLGGFRDYLLDLGFSEVWVKVRDEIGHTEVDEWIAEAGMFHRSGFRTWTTVTDNVARRADCVSRMNPVCDGWVLQHMLFDEWRALVSGTWTRREGEHAFGDEWKAYSSGGAERTYSQQFFDLEGLPEWKLVESVRVFEDGVELRQIQGPWGNTEAGVFANRGPFFYLTPTDGSDPREDGRTYTVRYTWREADPDGEALAAIDADDQVLYYTSLQRDLPYPEMRRLAWLALARDLPGYGTWTYYWWREENRSVEWMDDRVISSPAVEGVRDGNEDAALFVLARERIAGLQDDAAREALQQRLGAILGGDDPILPMEERTYERYVARPVWQDIAVEDDDRFRAAKRAVIELLEDLER